jgi:predicted transcriptional regulator
MNKEELYCCSSIEDIKQYGAVQAIILGRIRWWCHYNEQQKDKHKFHEGYYWSGWMTGKDFEEQTGLPSSTVYRNLNELMDRKIIFRERFNKMKRDKSGWYRINLNSQNENTNSQNENTNSQNENINSQNDNTLPVNLPVNHSVSLAGNLENNNTSNILGKNQLEKQLIEMFPMFEKNELLHLLARNKMQRIDEVLDNPKNNINEKHAWNLIYQYQTNK